MRIACVMMKVGIAREKVVNIGRLSELAAAELFVASASREVRSFPPPHNAFVRPRHSRLSIVRLVDPKTRIITLPVLPLVQTKCVTRKVQDLHWRSYRDRIALHFCGSPTVYGTT